MNRDAGREPSPLDQLSFEEALRELEETVQRLEKGELTLEDAIVVYERGMALAQHCSDALDAADLQVQELTLSSGRRQQDVFDPGEVS